MRIERVSLTHHDAQRLIEEVQAVYVAAYGGPDETPVSPEEFEDERGAFYVGYDQTGGTGQAVASGAWRMRHDPEQFGVGSVAELKRMYVVPAARRRGLALQMLTHLEATALAAGAQAVVLETGTQQPDAIALYERCGYTPIEKFGLYACQPESLCYGRRL